jgi:hypothetical protein
MLEQNLGSILPAIVEQAVANSVFAAVERGVPIDAEAEARHLQRIFRGISLSVEELVDAFVREVARRPGLELVVPEK